MIGWIRRRLAVGGNRAMRLLPSAGLGRRRALPGLPMGIAGRRLADALSDCGRRGERSAA